MIGPSWVGDMVMAQSLLIALKTGGWANHIDVLAPAWSAPLLARMAQIRAPVTMPLGHGELGLSQRFALGRALRERNYGRAIVLPRSLKSALVPAFARIATRSGYRGEMRFGLINDIRALDKSVLRQTVQRYVALAPPREAMPCGEQPPEVHAPRLQVDEENQARVLARLGLSLDPPAVGLMPGAEYGPAKCWPLAHYAQLAGAVLSDGRQVWVFGSEKDHASAQHIVEMANAYSDAAGSRMHNLCGRTALVDAVDLIAATQRVVTNDSGLMHVAGAVGVGLLAFYGSTTPHFTPPLTARARILQRDLDCRPCFARECPLGHLDCLRTITPDEAYAALDTLPE